MFYYKLRMTLTATAIFILWKFRRQLPRIFDQLAVKGTRIIQGPIPNTQSVAIKSFPYVGSIPNAYQIPYGYVSWKEMFGPSRKVHFHTVQDMAIIQLGKQILSMLIPIDIGNGV